MRRRYKMPPAKRKANRLRVRLKRKHDAQFIIADRLRTFIRDLFRKGRRTRSGHAKATNALGCPPECLRCAIAVHFKPGMSFLNYGEWHLDHHEPLIGFDLADPFQLKQAQHFTNLRPLWAKENQSKGGGKTAKKLSSA